jgi:DNA-binding Lrp family transcriptional regulator
MSMVTAYIMVKAHTGEADRLKDDIEAVDGVERAHIVAGDVDLIAVADVESPAAVKDIAATEIQSVDGVSTTQTYIAMD